MYVSRRGLSGLGFLIPRALGSQCPPGHSQTAYGEQWMCTPIPQAPAAAAPVTVSPVITTNVSPQISPVFQQAFQPTNSPMSAGTQQKAGYDTVIPQSLPPAPVAPPAPTGPVVVEREPRPEPQPEVLPPVTGAGFSIGPNAILFGGAALVALFLILTKDERGRRATS